MSRPNPLITLLHPYLVLLRFVFGWLKKMFGWLKKRKRWHWLVILLLGGMLAATPSWLWPKFQEYRQYSRYFDFYYDSFLKDYQKQGLAADKAEFNAQYYARFYAKYYTSADFRYALQFALPSPDEKGAFSYPANSPNARRHISQRGLALLKQFEGLKLTAYRDIGGKLTIGYGHLIRPGETYQTITQAQADKLLRQDVKLAEAIVKRQVKVPLNQNQYDALVSFIYNIGEGHFRRSTLLKELNQRDYASAAEELLRWKHVKGVESRGLLRRRQTEKALFLAK
jgi:lysozyme